MVGFRRFRIGRLKISCGWMDLVTEPSVRSDAKTLETAGRSDRASEGFGP